MDSYGSFMDLSDSIFDIQDPSFLEHKPDLYTQWEGFLYHPDPYP